LLKYIKFSVIETWTHGNAMLVLSLLIIRIIIIIIIVGVVAV